MKRKLALALCTALCISGMVFANTVSAEENKSDVTLEFWDMPWGGSDYQDKVQELLAEYTELTGVKFDYTNISWDNWLQVFLTAVSSGNAPDISTGGSLLGHRLAAEDMMYNVEDFVNSEFSDGFFKEGAVDTFYAGDELIAVPWNMDCRSIYYRKDMFEEAGITELPKTWDEFYEACQKLTHDGQYGYVTAGTDNMAYWEFMFWSVANGGHFLNDDMQAEMANEPNVEAGEFLRKLYKDGLMPEGTPSYTTSDSKAMFLNGTSAMIMSGPTIIPEIRDAGLEDKVGVLPAMTSKNGLTQNVGSFNGIFVYKDSEHIQESLDFIKWFMSNNETLWTEGGMGSMPVVGDLLNISYFQEDPLYHDIVNVIFPSVVLQAYPYTHYTLEMDLMDSEQYYKNVVQSIYLTDDDIMDILVDADIDYNAALEELKME